MPVSLRTNDAAVRQRPQSPAPKRTHFGMGYRRIRPALRVPSSRGRASSRRPAIAVLVLDTEEQRFVEEQLTGTAAPRFCRTIGALAQLLRDGRVRAALVDLQDANGDDVVHALPMLREQNPDVPIVACFRPTPEALRRVSALVRTAPGVGILLRGYEHIGLAMSRLIAGPRTKPPSAAETLLQRVVPLAPTPLQGFFTVCSLKGSPHLRVTTAAAWSRIPRRTLERWLQEASLPGPAVVVGSCAALHAAWWLDRHDWPARQVLDEMGMAHLSSLTRLLQHHFGCSVRQLQGRGGFNVLLKQFEAMLHGGVVRGAFR